MRLFRTKNPLARPRVTHVKQQKVTPAAPDRLIKIATSTGNRYTLAPRFGIYEENEKNNHLIESLSNENPQSKETNKKDNR